MQLPPSIIQQAHAAIKDIYGGRLSKVLLFGSYARGEQTIESDIDLLVVLKDPQLSVGKEIRFMNEILFKMGFDNNISISAHPMTEQKFENGVSFFLDRVRKEAKQL